MKATMSIKGLYDYDHTVFSGLHLPDGVDGDLTISIICTELAELEIMYPSIVTMRRAIDDWSRSRVKAWTRIVSALDAEYAPTENYDRHEDWTDGGKYAHRVAGFNEGAQADANSGDSTSTHSGHVHGNIGVTMAQDMIRAEIDLRTQYDIAHIICDEFKRRFCLMVY